MERKKELIRLRDVSRFYEMGDSVVKALNKINFKVYEGEFVAIMGPSGSGKCVVGETEVIGRDGVPRKIEDFGEKALFSYDFNSGRVSPSKISGYHKRDESELIEIRTRGGRRIVVTEDHPFFSLDGGGVCKVFASNLKEGGFVACPRKIKFAGGSQKLDSFEKLSDDKSLVIYDSVNLVRRVFDKIGVSRAHVCKKLNINPGTYDCWKTKNNIPLKIFADILNLYGKNIGDYDKLLLTGRGSPKRIRVPVLTGPSLMEFYGYLAGDGNLDRDGVKFTNFD